MATNSQKPKKWVGIASGPNYGFPIACVLLLKGPTQLSYLLCLAPISLYLAQSAQPCPTLNTSTTSNIATIPTLSNPNNSTNYYFLNCCCSSLKP
jgi:hypothetical protein